MRRVRIDHQNVRPFKELTTEQKQRHNVIARYMIQFCLQNIGEYLLWSSIDSQVPHIYSWVFDDYNSSHQNTKIIWDKVGVKIVKIRRVK